MIVTIISCEVIATLGLLAVYEILCVKEKINNGEHEKNNNHQQKADNIK